LFGSLRIIPATIQWLVGQKGVYTRAQAMDNTNHRRTPSKGKSQKKKLYDVVGGKHQPQGKALKDLYNHWT
jgi:hypothetical protein